MLNMEYKGGQIGQFYHHRGCPLISHILYVDELLVFMNGARKSSYGNHYEIGKVVRVIYKSSKVGYDFL